MEDIISLDINQIAPNPMRPRASFPHDTLMELSDSIRRYGVIQPIVVAATPVGYQIVCGERRWRAAKLAGLDSIPSVILKDLKPQEMLILSLVENLHKESLTVFEQASVIQRLISDFNLTIQEIGENIGIGVEEIKKRLRLLNLSDKVKNEILARNITDREAVTLADSQDEREIYEEVTHKSRHSF